MKKRKHRASADHRIIILIAFLLAGLSWSCNDDLEKEDKGGKGAEGTEKITLPVNLSFVPTTETKAITRPVKPGSELEKAGFHYELEVVSSTTSDTLSTPDTKAVPTKLKNVVALLFGEKKGAYKGKAVISETVTAGSDLLLDFTVNATTDDSYRLVVVANDYDGTSYTSTSALSAFTGSYTDFLELTMTTSPSKDEDIPYVGSITGVKLEGASTSLVVPLYWSLAKISFNINNFSIKNGPALSGVAIRSCGKRYFGTPGEYNGSGSTETQQTRIGTGLTTPDKTETFYCGENIKTNSSVTSITDRCPAKAGSAAYLTVTSKEIATTNTTPAIGEEYITSGGVIFKYYIYFGDGSVSDFSVRRNTKYNITVNIDGTLKGQRRQALTDKRIEVSSSEVHAGLNIGRFGGRNSAEFTPSTSVNLTVGYYTKDLLIQPNTNKSNTTDSISMKWSTISQWWQTDFHRYWDPTFTSDKIDKTTGFAYDYCYNLTLGGVDKGTWYLPTQTQLAAMWGLLTGIQENSYYSGFTEHYYWSATDMSSSTACYVYFSNGFADVNGKGGLCRVRCVRDL